MDLGAGGLVGAYRIESLIGKGRVATVFRAIHVISQRIVALKVLDPHHATKPGVPERFSLTMSEVARLSHPNLVPVEHYGTVEGELYLANPLATGGTLEAIARGPLDTHDLIRALAEISAALDAVHAAGMAHGDVRPSNVLIPAPGRLWLADLGLARILGIEEVAPVYYQPPEAMLQSPEPTPAGDIFSLGVLAYQLLSGRLPFPAEQRDEAICERVNGPPSLMALRTGLSPLVDDAVARALDPRPARRFSAASDFAATLANALGVPFVVQQPSPPRFWSGLPLVSGEPVAPPQPSDPTANERRETLEPTVLPSTPPNSTTPPTIGPVLPAEVRTPLSSGLHSLTGTSSPSSTIGPPFRVEQFEQPSARGRRTVAVLAVVSSFFVTLCLAAGVAIGLAASGGWLPALVRGGTPTPESAAAGKVNAPTADPSPTEISGPAAANPEPTETPVPPTATPEPTTPPAPTSTPPPPRPTNTPPPPPTNTPPPQPVDGSFRQVGATVDPQLRFFEATCSPTATGTYSTSFQAASVRCIHAEVFVTYPATAVGSTVNFSWSMTGPQNVSGQSRRTISAAGSTSHTYLFNFSVPGSAVPGQYRVVVISGGQQVASGTFFLR